MFSSLFGATKTSSELNKGKASVDPASNLVIVQEVLECPVCYNVPDESPVYQCENGHLVSILLFNCSKKLYCLIIENVSMYLSNDLVFCYSLVVEIDSGLQRLSWKTHSLPLMQTTPRGVTKLGDFINNPFYNLLKIR